MSDIRFQRDNEALEKIASILATGIVRMKMKQVVLNSGSAFPDDQPLEGTIPELSTRSVDIPSPSTVIRVERPTSYNDNQGG